jgi:hypothetical protein
MMFAPAGDRGACRLRLKADERRTTARQERTWTCNFQAADQA